MSTAMFFLLADAVLLVLDQGRDGGTRVWRLIAVLVATAGLELDGARSRAHSLSINRAGLTWQRQFWVPPLPPLFHGLGFDDHCRRQAQR